MSKDDRYFTRKKYLFFGGSGSLGTEVINRWISDNKIMNVSRNEDKQWNLKMKIKNSNLEQMIGIYHKKMM